MRLPLPGGPHGTLSSLLNQVCDDTGIALRNEEAINDQVAPNQPHLIWLKPASSGQSKKRD